MKKLEKNRRNNTLNNKTQTEDLLRMEEKKYSKKVLNYKMGKEKHPGDIEEIYEAGTGNNAQTIERRRQILITQIAAKVATRLVLITLNAEFNLGSNCDVNLLMIRLIITTLLLLANGKSLLLADKAMDPAIEVLI